MFLILNWRGGWWIKENPDWGRVVPSEEVPTAEPPLPGPQEAPQTAEAEGWAEMVEQHAANMQENWRRNGWVQRMGANGALAGPLARVEAKEPMRSQTRTIDRQGGHSDGEPQTQGTQKWGHNLPGRTVYDPRTQKRQRPLRGGGGQNELREYIDPHG